jgi:hypothetical protein
VRTRDPGFDLVGVVSPRVVDERQELSHVQRLGQVRAGPCSSSGVIRPADCRDLPGGQRLTAATREQAERLRARLVQESQQASIVAVQDRDLKIDAYADRWLDQIATSVERRTVASYCQILRPRGRAEQE